MMIFKMTTIIRMLMTNCCHGCHLEDHHAVMVIMILKTIDNDGLDDHDGHDGHQYTIKKS